MSVTTPTNSQLWTSELAEETRQWMRYLYFRPWMKDKTILDLGGSTRFGAAIASVEATSVDLVTNVDALDSIYPNASIGLIPLTHWDTCASRYDVVFSFGALNHCDDPILLLANLANCSGQIAVGYEPDGKWSFDCFRSAIEEAFEGRPIRWLWQQPEWPYRLTENETEGAGYWVAAIGEEAPISWPSLGISMPTMDNPACVKDAVLGLTRTYPGQLHIAVTANGSSAATLTELKQIETELPNQVTILESETNLGYGQGCNRGLDFLVEKYGFEGQENWMYGVCNDDVLPDPECLGELVYGMIALKELGLNPGLIGPVSNYVNGAQQVQISEFNSYSSMLDSVLEYRREHHSSATQTKQVRGLLWIVDAKCLQEVGGFDPIFGIGNFEDDDYNLRTSLAGYTLWIADGAFLYHHGSTTFRQLDVNYESNIERNSEALTRKWNLSSIDQWVQVDAVPAGVSNHVPLGSWNEPRESHLIQINGEKVDLIHQASDIEFAAWVMKELKAQPRASRKLLIDTIQRLAA